MKGDEGSFFSKAPDWKPLFLPKIKFKQNQAAQIRNTMLYSSIIIRISGPMPKPKCRRISTVCSRYSCAVWAGELCSLGTFCSFYSHLSSKTVFSALKLTQSCYYKYEHLSLEKWQFNHKLGPPQTYRS